MADDKIIPINRPKLVSNTGGPINTTPGSNEATTSAPETSTFQFDLIDGTTFQETGFLIVTPSFVGVGEGEGKVLAMVPTANLQMVRRAVDDTIDVELDDETET